jgi:type VI secretion system secreted protein Hcp
MAIMQARAGDAVHAANIGQYYMTLKGKVQGDIKGDVKGSTKGKNEGKIAVYAWRWEVNSPRDVATGHASGKRQHKPLHVKIPAGGYTPQLATALYTNELLTEVVLEFYRPQQNGSGEWEKYFTIKLADASVATMTSSAGFEEGEPQDEVSFTFRKITLTHEISKKEAEDDWERQA